MAAALVLAGCSSGGGLYALGAVETVSVVNTDKLLSDHVVSAVSGRDCSSSRRQRENTPYCIDYDHDPPPKREAVYCYRTLASVSCYDAPNPYGTDVRVGTPLGTAQGR